MEILNLVKRPCSQIAEMSQQINRLDDELKQKYDEVALMQSELKMVKEFRRKRGQMQKELDEVIF